MLFTYKYVNGHEVEKFQRYSNFLFLKVWSRARTPFDSSKLSRLPELKNVYESFDYLTDPKSWGYQFNFQVEAIYIEFLKISKSQQKRLRRYYKVNNSIHALFVNSGKEPISYSRLEMEFPDLTKELKKFYRNLYGSKSPFLLQEFGNFNSLKKKHYRSFFDLNFHGHEGVCPFCGINHIKGNDHTKLEAYDHLIPKGKYPFSSVNFRNLAVMCNECNSAYKNVKSILFTKDKPAARRIAFYPYSNETWKVNFKIVFKQPFSIKLRKSDISINMTCNNRADQIASWQETFGIEERYKAKLLSDFSGRVWYEKFRSGIVNARVKYNNPGMDYNEWTRELTNECLEMPLAELNFLKMPFYEECLRTNP